MVFSRFNFWAVAVALWIAVILFSSTSLAAEWSEQAFHFCMRLLFGHVGPEDRSYGLLHLLADKGFHVAMFLILAVLLWQLIAKPHWKIPRILLAGAVVGSSSEFLQRFFPGRDPAVTDVLINIGGTAVGIIVILAAINLMRPHSPQAEPVSYALAEESD